MVCSGILFYPLALAACEVIHEQLLFFKRFSPPKNTFFKTVITVIVITVTSVIPLCHRFP